MNNRIQRISDMLRNQKNQTDLKISTIITVRPTNRKIAAKRAVRLPNKAAREMETSNKKFTRRAAMKLSILNLTV